MNHPTNENDLANIIATDTALYFYSSKDTLLTAMMIPIIENLNKTKDVLCIDLAAFNNLHKRFDIKEMPTILIMSGGQELKRIIGIPTEI